MNKTPDSNQAVEETDLPRDIRGEERTVPAKPSVDAKKITIELADKLPDNAVEALGRLAKSPFVQTLVQFIPGVGPAFGIAVATTYEEIYKIRSHAFFEELGKGNITLTEEDVQNNEFLHAYHNTLKYVMETRTKEKIRLFANLFIIYYRNKRFDEDADEYEDNSKILHELSCRELQVLIILYELESDPKYVHSTESGLPRENLRDKFWGEFKKRAENEAGVPKGEFNGFMTRLSRTGLYQPDVQGFFSSGKGGLTPNFYSFFTALGEIYSMAHR